MSSFNRRRFLQASAGAAAVATTARVLAAPSENLHFALIGAGGEGMRIASKFSDVPGVKMTAICEINPIQVEEAKKLSPDAKVYEDWNEMLAAEDDLQAVTIALPEHTHAPAAIAAMKAGKDVFCEKPMAYSLDDAREMIKTRDETGRVLQIGQQRRSNPLYYLAERLIQKEGIIGEVIRVDAFWDRWEDWKRPLPAVNKDFTPWGFPTLNHLINWRLYREYGHGLMTENGTHQMDAASWLLGDKRPKTVCGMGAITYHDQRETHDVVSAEYMFEGDTLVRFTQDFHQGFNYGWSYGELFLGTEGSLRITAQKEIVVYDKKRKATRVPIERLGEIELGGVVATVDELNAAEADRENGLAMYSYDHEMRIFANAVKNHAPVTCTGEIGLNSITYTITGTEAQFAGEYKQFAPEMFV